MRATDLLLENDLVVEARSLTRTILENLFFADPSKKASSRWSR
jgi:hypothetical protein